MAAGGRSRAEARDRVVVVADPDDVRALELELQGLPERPASVAACLTVDRAAASADALFGLAPDLLAPVLVPDGRAQREPRVFEKAAALPRPGVDRTSGRVGKEVCGRVA